MTSALVLLADGFEEIEAVTIIDVLRRAQMAVTVVAIGLQRVTGSHGIVVEADETLDGFEGETAAPAGDREFDLVVLPGGMPGAKNLRDEPRVARLLQEQARANRYVAAICAAPIVLEAAGILQGCAATSYPGYDLPSADYREERVVVAGKVVTSRGPGTAIEFSLKLVELLVGPDVATKLGTAMIVTPR